MISPRMDLVSVAVGLVKLVEPEQHPQLVKLLNTMKLVAMLGAYLNHLLIIRAIAADNANWLYCYFTHNQFVTEMMN